MKLNYFLLAVFALFLIAPDVPALQDLSADDAAVSSSTDEMEERNKALARRFYEQVWFSNNPQVVDEIFAPTYVAHDIGDRKGISEPAEEQKIIAQRFWNNGNMSGSIDFQIADGDLVATRWHWDYEPTTWWMKLVAGRRPLPIINVFRFQNGKIVEIWNHRHDIDFLGRSIFGAGVAVGLIPALVLAIVVFLMWRKIKRLRRAAAV